MTTGFIQMTPMPESHFKNNNVLDRMIRAVDGDDPADAKKAWYEAERSAFLKWSGLGESQWRFTMLVGFPTKFMTLSGPWTGEDEGPPIEAELQRWISTLSGDVMMGDVGCYMQGQSFDGRAQWKVKTGGRLGALRSVSQAKSGLSWTGLAVLSLVVAVVATVLAWMVMNG